MGTIDLKLIGVITAFNLAETYRTPVFFMMDEVVGHMTERVVIPEAGAIEVTERRWTTKPPGQYKPYDAGGGWVPDMTKAGDGHRMIVQAFSRFFSVRSSAFEVRVEARVDNLTRVYHTVLVRGMGRDRS